MSRKGKKKRRPKYKKDSLEIHFMKRVWQRLRLWISKKDIKVIQEYVREGNHEKDIFFYQSNRVIGFRYKLLNRVKIVILWDTARHTPITVLKRGWLEEKYSHSLDENGIIDIRV